MKTPEKRSNSKFTILDDNSDNTEIMKDLMMYADFMAQQYANDNHPLMTKDEIYSEMMEEIAKGLKHYSELKPNHLCATIKTMMKNRISELRYKYYVTHRKGEKQSYSLDAELIDGGSTLGDVIASEFNTEDIIESIERVRQLRARLSPTAKRILDSVLESDTYDSDRIDLLMRLAAMRAATVKYMHLRIRPYHVSEALCIPELDCKKAWAEIVRAYQEVSR